MRLSLQVAQAAAKVPGPFIRVVNRGKRLCWLLDNPLARMGRTQGCPTLAAQVWEWLASTWHWRHTGRQTATTAWTMALLPALAPARLVSQDLKSNRHRTFPASLALEFIL